MKIRRKNTNMTNNLSLQIDCKVKNRERKTKEYIPRYLIKRKIDNVKKRILMRKFGYMYLLKTCGKILPSTARRWYLKQILRKSLNKWIMYWYDEKVLWRLMLRAKIHYEYKTKRNFFDRWKFHISNKRTRYLRKIFIRSYYKRNLKIRYFNNFKYYTVISKKEIEYQTYLQREYIEIYKVLYLNELKLWTTKLTEELVGVLIATKYSNNLLLSRYFNAIKFFSNKRQHKLQNHNKANIFFKKKYSYEMFYYIFDTWKLYHKTVKENQEKLSFATEFYNRKISYKLFEVYLKYYRYRQNFKMKINLAEENYNKIVMKRSLRNCRNFIKEKIMKQQRYYLAETHYFQKIESRIFLLWLTYHRRYAVLNRRINEYNYVRYNRLLRKYLLQWNITMRMYILERQKISMALYYFDKKLMGKYLNLLVLNKIAEKAKFLDDITKVEKYCNEKAETFKRNCFTKWKNMNRYKKLRKVEADKLKTSLLFKCMQNYFSAWKIWTNNKQISYLMRESAILMSNKKLLNSCIVKWKQYTVNQYLLKEKLEESKSLFNKFIMQMSLEYILSVGNKSMANNYRDIVDYKVEIFYFKLFYFKKWKYNTWNKWRENKYRDNNKITDILSTMNTTYLKPKIPVYLKM